MQMLSYFTVSPALTNLTPSVSVNAVAPSGTLTHERSVRHAAGSLPYMARYSLGLIHLFSPLLKLSVGHAPSPLTLAFT